MPSAVLTLVEKRLKREGMMTLIPESAHV